MKKADLAEIAGTILGALFMFVLMAFVGGFLVQTTVGYFGYELTLWQGWVAAFTVSWCCKATK